jgi:hypothetical protein
VNEERRNWLRPRKSRIADGGKAALFHMKPSGPICRLLIQNRSTSFSPRIATSYTTTMKQNRI